MTNSTRFNFWIGVDDLKKVKKKAKKENRSTANYIKCKILGDVKK